MLHDLAVTVTLKTTGPELIFLKESLIKLISQID